MDPNSADPPRFRGETLDVRPGETLVRALARRGLPTLQRSIRYHRPRAPFCGVGACTQCLVRVNGQPNVRACTYRPSAGDRIETENAWPSPRNDLLGVLDLIFRSGLDTLRGFRRPAFATPVYHRVVRRLAGYGRAPDATSARPLPAPFVVETDFVVVGGGRAGRAAAKRLSDAGETAYWLDQGDLSDVPGGVSPLARTRAVFLPPPTAGGARGFHLLASSTGGQGVSIRSRAVIVATGAYDGGLLFPGNDRPGVLTAEGAMATASDAGPPPFSHAMVVGGGERAAALLDRFGSVVDAVVAPGTIDSAVVERASALDVPLYPRSLLRGVSGRRRVRSAHLSRRAGAERFDLPCDAVLLAHRRVPNAQLFFQAGARMHWRGAGGAYFPVLDQDLTTSVAGLFAAGEVAGFHGTSALESSGRAAAEAALGRPAHLDRLPARVAADGPNELEGYYRELLPLLEGHDKIVACACEDVLLNEVREAVRNGYRGVEVVKRLTGIGTGLCQGRYCLPDALIVLALLEGRPVEEVGYITQRPPVFPTALSTLASLYGSTTAEETA